MRYENMTVMDAWYYSYVLLPLLIFFARITDVTLGTMRIILVSRGRRSVVPFLAFFEVLIWLVAIGQTQGVHVVADHQGTAGGVVRRPYPKRRFQPTILLNQIGNGLGVVADFVDSPIVGQRAVVRVTKPWQLRQQMDCKTAKGG
jgi:hypothetical protein